MICNAFPIFISASFLAQVYSRICPYGSNPGLFIDQVERFTWHESSFTPSPGVMRTSATA
jgi:hypothetical protein